MATDHGNGVSRKELYAVITGVVVAMSTAFGGFQLWTLDKMSDRLNRLESLLHEWLRAL